MRTRKANRTKRYTAPDSEPASDADDDFQEQDASSPSVASESPPPQPAPRQRRPKAKPKPAASGYLDVEPVATDFVVRGYAGRYDRSMRGNPLINAWYGPEQRSIRLTQAILDRWFLWTVLPPRYPPSSFTWTDAPDTSAWKEKLHAEAQPTRYAVVADAQNYRMSELRMPLLTGLYNDPKEVAFTPGTSYTLSHSWTPVQDEEATGFLFDAGGIVTGLDWARRQGTQMLALAVIPHADQEQAVDYEKEHQDPEYKRYASVQIWEMDGESKKDVMVPATTPAILQRTLCLDHGRVTRVKWSPEHDHLALLCADRVCIVEVTAQMDKSTFGMSIPSAASSPPPATPVGPPEGLC